MMDERDGVNVNDVRTRAVESVDAAYGFDADGAAAYDSLACHATQFALPTAVIDADNVDVTRHLLDYEITAPLSLGIAYAGTV